MQMPIPPVFAFAPGPPNCYNSYQCVRMPFVLLLLQALVHSVGVLGAADGSPSFALPCLIL